jgi:hypothetical protein
MDRPNLRSRRFFARTGRRPRRGLTPAVRSLEGRQLLSATPQASAVMTQTATLPDLELSPTLSNQAILYFSSTMGTLTEVDLVTSGSFQTQFSAENLAPSSRTIVGTTSANLSIDAPTGAVPVVVPPVTESFDASAFDGTDDYGGTSGATLAPVTSSSTPQTTVLTSPADLAAFTGHFRIPLSVSGHATGSTAADNGDVSAAFNTDTSATITVVYHYIPNLPPLDPPPASSTPSTGSGTNAAPTPSTGAVAGATGAVAGATGAQALSTQTDTSSTGATTHGSARTRKASHPQNHPVHRQEPKQSVRSRHHPRQPGLSGHAGRD